MKLLPLTMDKQIPRMGILGKIMILQLEQPIRSGNIEQP
jgi:hypothetical protein